MLELELFCFRPVSGQYFRLRGTTSVVSGGRVVTYATTLLDYHGVQFAHGVLRDHPRWSEPLIGVLARCLEASLEGRELVRWFDYRHATLNVRLRGQLVIHDVACADRVALERGRDDLPTPFDTSAPQNVWDVARLACASLAWGELSIPRMPEPLQLPVYDHEGTRYCRSSDLPDEACVAFDRCSFGASRPSVPGVLDAAFEWDMQHFLGAT